MGIKIAARSIPLRVITFFLLLALHIHNTTSQSTFSNETPPPHIENEAQFKNDDRDFPSNADIHYKKDTVQTIAFGSCHLSRAIRPGSDIVWDAVKKSNPDSFLWMGDAIYPKHKGDAPISILKSEYQNTLTNTSIGYHQFITNSPPKLGIHGTWDDHDYGGNDRGVDMPNKQYRLSAFYHFMMQSNKFTGKDYEVVVRPEARREGSYHSVSYGTFPRKVTVYFLDTRYSRSKHCIPSIASTHIPLGSVISCVTRWISSILYPVIHSYCHDGDKQMLGDAQWEWLNDAMLNAHDDSSLHLIVSSVQILTTNPVVESWGHFDEERNRLLRLISSVVVVRNNNKDKNTNSANRRSRVVLLSGDVHHAEILAARPTNSDVREEHHNNNNLTPPKIIEVTSSGMTHSCETPFYGFACQPIIRAFAVNHAYPLSSNHSIQPNNETFYTGRNYGTIHIDWKKDDDPSKGEVEAKDDAAASVRIDIHDMKNNVVLSTGPLSLSITNDNDGYTEEEIQSIPKVLNKRYASVFFQRMMIIMLLFGIIMIVGLVFLQRYDTVVKSKTEKIH